MHRDTAQNCSSNVMWFKVNGYGGIEVQWFSRILIEIQHKVVVAILCGSVQSCSTNIIYFSSI